MTRAFLASAFQVWPPLRDPDYVTAAVTAAFAVGLGRSLVPRTTDPNRFVLGVYVLLVLTAMAGLGALGMYAFGDIRYALFVHGPLLLLAALGCADILRWLARLVQAATERFLAKETTEVVGAVGVASLIVVALVATLASAGELRRLKHQFSDSFGPLLLSILGDQASQVVMNEFASVNLDALGFATWGRPTVVVSQAGQDLAAFRDVLSSAQDVLLVEYGDSTPAYTAEIARTHVKSSEERLEHWLVTHWDKRDEPLAVLVPEDTGPKTPPPPVTVAPGEAMRLVGEYGRVLTATTASPGMVFGASTLPAAKPRLKAAILTLLGQAAEAAEERVLRSAFLSLAMFQDGVGGTPVAVDLPSPNGESWRTLRGREQDRLAAELAAAGF